MKSYWFKICLIIGLVIPLQQGLAQEMLIEAESGVLMNGSGIVNSSLCSGGQKVGKLGDPSKNGGVKFNFSLAVEGDYKLNLYYLTAEARSFRVTINGTPPITVNCPSSGGWDIPAVLTQEAHLYQGTNTLLIDNNTGFAPDLDMIVINASQEIKADTADIKHLRFSKWELGINSKNGQADIFYNSLPLILQSQLSFKESGDQYFSENLALDTILESGLNDIFGIGKLIQVIAATANHEIKVTRNFYLYENKEFVLTDFNIESARELSSNYMAPIYSNASSYFLPSEENQTLTVPYDNDKWVRYQSMDFGVPLSGYEVSAFFNTGTREGLIIGSIEHDAWKTGIRATTLAGNVLSRLEAFGGVTSNETRDVLPHGSMKGTKIKSPKMMLGYFSDWRRGMETYADLNEQVAPKLPWSKGKVFGWNSWGAIQTNLSYTNATEVSAFFADHLQNNNFSNDSTVYIGLDSYWDNITYSNLVKFVKECKTRGQNAGIYWTPFVDWSKDPNRLVEGSSGVYYRDIYLYANGNHQEIAGAWAIDPTHPATKRRADLYLNRFLTQGFTFLKLDFMTHGSLESDSHYDPSVNTGMQAYNQGLKYMADYLNGRMFINFSISPLFPSQYAHGRRIACDAYANISNTEYTLNSLTYGWWLDHVYTYNDADNVVFNGVSLGENRARATSSVITGIFIAGDDLSNSGYSTAKTRATTYLTNAEVNRVARLSKAFFPVEAAHGSIASDMFMQNVEDTLYIAVFNYSSTNTTKTIQMDRVGLKSGTSYVVHELWSNTKSIKTDSWIEPVLKRDVKFLKIYEGTATTVHENPVTDNLIIFPNPCHDFIHFKNKTSGNSTVKIYNSTGQLVKVFNNTKDKCFVGDLSQGLYLLTEDRKDGSLNRTRFVKN
jgi:alpha-galactosidase